MIPINFIEKKVKNNQLKFDFLAYNIKLNDNNKTISFNFNCYKKINKYIYKIFIFCITGHYSDESFYNLYYNKKFKKQDTQLLEYHWLKNDLNCNIFLIKTKFKFMKG